MEAAEALASPLDRFAREYQEYHGLVSKRRHDQMRALEDFAEFTGKDLLDCTGNDFAAWLTHINESGLNVNTVRFKGNCVRPFYSWAYSVGLINGETLMSIRSVRNPKGSTSQGAPRPYNKKELKQFFEALDVAYPKLPDYRLGRFFDGRMKYRRVAVHAQRLQLDAIIAVALYGGLRRQEILDLTVDDLHPENEYIVVRSGKGGKARAVPHTKATRSAITTWLEFREKLEPDHDSPWLGLAPNVPTGVWSHPLLLNRLTSMLRKVEGDWTLHRFRHTAATNWLRAGVKLELVSRLLGHAKIQQTLMYAELVNGDVQNAVTRAEDAFASQINPNEE